MDRHVAIAEAPLRGRRARVIVLAIVVNVAVIISVHRRPAGLGVAPDTVVLILDLVLASARPGLLHRLHLQPLRLQEQPVLPHRVPPASPAPFVATLGAPRRFVPLEPSLLLL